MGDVIHLCMKPGELRCSGFPDVRNRQSKKPARQRQCFGALDRLNCLSRVLFPENTRGFLCSEIEFSELLDFQCKQIERLAYQTAFNQFVCDDSADAFYVE